MLSPAPLENVLHQQENVDPGAAGVNLVSPRSRSATKEKRLTKTPSSALKLTNLSTPEQPTQSVALSSVPLQTVSSPSVVVVTPTRQKSPRRANRRLKGRSLPEPGSPFDRVEEGARWNDVVLEREQQGTLSPLRIYVNPLRLFDPTRIQSVTGNKPVFDVVLEDPFLPTPERKQHRNHLNKKARSTSFSVGIVRRYSEGSEAESSVEIIGGDAPPRTTTPRSQQLLLQQQQRLASIPSAASAAVAMAPSSMGSSSGASTPTLSSSAPSPLQSSSSSSSISRLPTPRLTTDEEKTLTFTQQHQPIAPSATTISKRGGTTHKIGVKSSRKANGGRKSRILSATSKPLSGDDSTLNLDVEIPSEQATPRWGTRAGIVRWVAEKGTAEDKLVLALTYRKMMKANELMDEIQSLFVSDCTPDKRIRKGVLEFVSIWVSCFQFHSRTYQDSVVERLSEFLQHTNMLYEGMLQKRHWHAHIYSDVPSMLKNVVIMQQDIKRSNTAKADFDAKWYYEPSGVHLVLRSNADMIATYACVSSTSSSSSAAAGGGAAVAIGGLDEIVSQIASGSSNGSGAMQTYAQIKQFLKMDVKKLALALSFVDGALFADITGNDLLRGSRSGPAVIPNKLLNGRRVVRVNTIVNLTNHWNNLSRWPATVILCAQKPGSDAENAKFRAKLFKRFVDLAVELRELDNWSAFFGIVIGLGSSTLACLKDTWKLIPAKTLATFRELEEACQPAFNFKQYRDAITRRMDASEFCVPYLAIVLKDLQAVDEGNPTKDGRGWVNFEKLQLLSAVLRRVRQLQSIACPTKSLDRKYLQYVTTQIWSVSENELWEQSKVVKQQEADLAASVPLKRSMRDILEKSGKI